MNNASSARRSLSADLSTMYWLSKSEAFMHGAIQIMITTIIPVSRDINTRSQIHLQELDTHICLNEAVMWHAVSKCHKHKQGERWFRSQTYESCRPFSVGHASLSLWGALACEHQQDTPWRDFDTAAFQDSAATRCQSTRGSSHRMPNSAIVIPMTIKWWIW